MGRVFIDPKTGYGDHPDGWLLHYSLSQVDSNPQSSALEILPILFVRSIRGVEAWHFKRRGAAGDNCRPRALRRDRRE